MSNDEQARIEKIVNPAISYLSRVRAEEMYAVSSGDLELAEHLHGLHQQAVTGLQKVLTEWKANKRFPVAQKHVKHILANYV